MISFKGRHRAQIFTTYFTRLALTHILSNPFMEVLYFFHHHHQRSEPRSFRSHGEVFYQDLLNAFFNGLRTKRRSLIFMIIVSMLAGWCGEEQETSASGGNKQLSKTPCGCGVVGWQPNMLEQLGTRNAKGSLWFWFWLFGRWGLEAINAIVV